jgi:hypothetical protein
MIIGGAAMPACCAANAWNPRLQQFFAVPVVALVVGVSVLLTGMVRA